MLYSLANTLFICFGLYAALAVIVVIVAFLKELPDMLADGLDAVITTGARVMKPDASEAQVNRWCEAAFGYSLAVLGVGALYLIGQSALLIFG